MKNVINTTVWHPFVVGEIFSQVRGKEKAPKQNLDGNTPLIQETNSNNGFDRYVKPTKVIKGNSITVSINYAQNVFYQPKDYCASVNIVSLHNESLNPYNGKFIATVLANAHKKYTYTNKISKDRLNAEIIRLPAITKLTPDYQKLETFAGGGTNMSNIDTSSWKEFEISELFDIHPTKNLGLTNHELFSTTGNTPVIVNSSYNNGIGGYVDLPATEDGGIITFSDTTDANSIFYQKENFIGYSHVQGMYPKFNNNSDEIMQYIMTAFKAKALTKGYNYSNKFRRDDALKIKILLPAKIINEPDWQYMEEYMKNIESEVTSKIDKFQMILGNEKHKIDTQKWGGV